MTHIGLPAQHGLEALRRVLVEEVHDRELDAGNRVDVQQVDADDAALALLAEPHLRRGDLRPAARRRAEIDDALAGLEQLVLVVDLR